MKNISNTILLIISLILIAAGIAIVPMAALNQNLALLVMTFIIIGLFGIIRFIAKRSVIR